MPCNLLLVDNERAFRQELCDCLEEYRVSEAASGEEALQILKKANDIDLVILDVLMPGLNGIETLQKIRQMNPALGIIMTGKSSEDIAIEVLKAHADDYLQKPFSVEALKDSIARILKTKDVREDIDTSDIMGKIEKAKEFARRNFHKKVLLADAAQTVNLSPKYLSRIFKEKAGTGFNEFTQHIRVEKAKELLGKTGFNVNQISDKLGYQNPESFIRQFKKITKKTPTEFRKQVSAPPVKTKAAALRGKIK